LGACPYFCGINLDFTIENDVLPLNGADVLPEHAVEREVGCGRQAGDLSGLPVDNVGQDKCQTGAGFHLVVDVAGIDATSLTVIDCASHGMQFLDLQQSASNPGPDLRFGHIVQVTSVPIFNRTISVIYQVPALASGDVECSAIDGGIWF